MQPVLAAAAGHTDIELVAARRARDDGHRRVDSDALRAGLGDGVAQIDVFGRVHGGHGHFGGAVQVLQDQVAGVRGGGHGPAVSVAHRLPVIGPAVAVVLPGGHDCVGHSGWLVASVSVRFALGGLVEWLRVQVGMRVRGAWSLAAASPAAGSRSCPRPRIASRLGPGISPVFPLRTACFETRTGVARAVACAEPWSVADYALRPIRGDVEAPQ